MYKNRASSVPMSDNNNKFIVLSPKAAPFAMDISTKVVKRTKWQDAKKRALSKETSPEVLFSV